jgi:aryl-alcohol dehydrogenase-like predicted oxidoreductase
VADLGVSVEQTPELALRFCLSHPAVSTAIAGMRTVAHAEGNARAIGAGPLSDDQLERLRGHRWVRDFYRAPAGV